MSALYYQNKNGAPPSDNSIDTAEFFFFFLFFIYKEITYLQMNLEFFKQKEDNNENPINTFHRQAR